MYVAKEEKSREAWGVGVKVSFAALFSLTESLLLCSLIRGFPLISGFPVRK